jgi:1-acyl-sn-glycerol-3-phosphate acyltransferase
MRHALLGVYTYAEFFLSAVLFLFPMSWATLFGKADPGQRIRGRWMRRFGRFTNRLSPLWTFSVEGSAPADAMTVGHVVISNHQSTSDPFLLCWLPFDMRFVAKESLFKLPLIGWLMRLSGDIPLRRGDKQSVVEMKEACLATLRSGMNVMLFPEGTRSPDGNLLPFKDGAFQIAIEAQAPILPVALNGTRACRPKGSPWFGEAKASVRILEPIPTQGLTLEALPALRERAREAIAKALREGVGAAPVAA